MSNRPSKASDPSSSNEISIAPSQSSHHVVHSNQNVNRNETEINQQSDKMKLLDYDENYLAELKEEKETLSKNVKENSHILRLLENGKLSCKVLFKSL